MGPVLVVIGPSGSGKTTLIAALEDRGAVIATPTWTTRPPRADEAEGSTNHRFVSDERFAALVGDRFFVAATEMGGYRYGLPALCRPDDDRLPALVARSFALPLLEAIHVDTLVYQIEAPLPRVRRILAERRTSVSDVRARLSDYSEECAVGRSLARRVFVNTRSPEELVEAVEQALLRDVVAGRSTS